MLNVFHLFLVVSSHEETSYWKHLISFWSIWKRTIVGIFLYRTCLQTCKTSLICSNKLCCVCKAIRLCFFLSIGYCRKECSDHQRLTCGCLLLSGHIVWNIEMKGNAKELNLAWSLKKNHTVNTSDCGSFYLEPGCILCFRQKMSTFWTKNTNWKLWKCINSWMRSIMGLSMDNHDSVMWGFFYSFADMWIMITFNI